MDGEEKTCPEEKVGPIQQALSTQTDALERLEAVTAKIEKIFEPVLQPEVPQDKGKSGVDTPRVNSIVTSKIETSTRRIRSLTDRLSRLLGRVDL